MHFRLTCRTFIAILATMLHDPDIATSDSREPIGELIVTLAANYNQFTRGSSV